MRLILYVLLLLFPVGISAHGLKFNNIRTPSEPKTSYRVFVDYKPVFTGKMVVSFDMSIYDYNTFGYLFRITDNKQKDADVYNFMFSCNDDKISFLKFNIEGKRNLVVDTLRNVKLGHRQWFRVEVVFDLKADAVSVLVGDRFYVVRDLDLPDRMQPDIVFGSSEYSEDTPSFAIRNVSISGSKRERARARIDSQQRFNFKLDENDGLAVHDAHGDRVGETVNPTWLITDSYHWRKRFSFKSNSVAAVSYDKQNNALVILNQDSLVMFHTANDSVSISRYANSMPLHMVLGTSYIDAKRGLVYAYEVNNLPVNAVMGAVLNTKTLEWRANSYKFLPTQRHHHASYFDPDKQTYLIFGGFGNREYSNEFVEYSIADDTWKVVPFGGDHITPRFFTSMGDLTRNELLIFGGTGNSVGDQTIGRFNFYDLYKVNLENKTVKKLWGISADYDYVPSRNLIISDDKTSFYAMRYRVQDAFSHLKLCRYSIADGSHEIVGDSIPIVSRAITTNTNIYYDSNTREYYCYVQEFEDGRPSSQITLYSLASPVVSAAALQQYSNDDGYSKNVVAIAVLALLLLIAGVYISYRLFVRGAKVKSKEEDSQTTLPPTITKQIVEGNDRKVNAIYLFGEFKVYDVHGRDVTYMFSKKIKQMLLFILLNSDGEDGGVTSSQLYEILWPDKSFQNAKNLKGVTMNHLRKILGDMAGIKLNFNNTYFRIDIDDSLYCDYVEFARIVNHLNNPEFSDKTKDLVRSVIALISRGEFLKGMTGLGVDVSKRQFEEQVISIFTVALEHSYYEQSYNDVCDIAASLMDIDSLSDIALWYEVNALNRMRQAEVAKKRYYIFTIRYNKLMEANYPHTFETLISESLDVVL